MRKYYFEDQLEKKLITLFKKDKKRYSILMKKVDEIVTSNDVDHYKNLRKPLQHLKRVHIDAHFVLVFRYNRAKNTIYFYDLDHHDNIYK